MNIPNRNAHDKPGTLEYFYEIALITLFSLWVGRIYINFNPLEYIGSQGNDNFFLGLFNLLPLTRLFHCGACILWNGSLNGGTPAFGNPQSLIAHPLVALFTLIFGALNGYKLLAAATIVIGALSQWWIAKALGLGRIGRLWSGIFAAVAGHLAWPFFSAGNVAFSTACTSLAIASGLQFALKTDRKNAVVFGILAGLSFLAGNAIISVGFLVFIIPALLFIILGREIKKWCVLQELLLSVLISILVAAIYIIPSFSFIGKYQAASAPQITQALEYIPVNLIARDPAYFNNELLGKSTPSEYFGLYIGWLPVIFAVVAWRLIPREKLKLFWFFLVSILLLLFLSSTGLYNWILNIGSGSLITTQVPASVLGLVVVMVLGLSAWGLDLAWNKITVDLIISRGKDRPDLKVNPRWFLLMPLLISLVNTYNFNQTFRTLDMVPHDLALAARSLAANEARWVSPPTDNWSYSAISTLDNIKITSQYESWSLPDRPAPPASISATMDLGSSNSPDFYKLVGPVVFLKSGDVTYASVTTLSGKIEPCSAIADGGWIKVTCDTTESGNLQVYENNWNGWKVRIDGSRAHLLSGNWLNVDAPQGPHIYSFRYLPWDVPIGYCLFTLGLFFSLWLWFTSTHVSQQIRNN